MTYEELRERVARETWEHVEGENSWAHAGTGDKFNHRGFTDLTIRAVIEALAQEAEDPSDFTVAWDGSVGTNWSDDDTCQAYDSVADWLRSHTPETTP